MKTNELTFPGLQRVGTVAGDTEITGGYTSDLLSDVRNFFCTGLS